MPYRKLFLSRWSALIWAIGIIITAVQTVGFAPDKRANAPTGRANAPTEQPAMTDATGAPITPADLSNLANIASAL
jgi:hypothetical protein